MLSRKENPALFEMVKITLMVKHGVKNIGNVDVLPDSLLSKVKKLSTFDVPTRGRGLRTLKGIEKLKNLTTLCVAGINIDRKIGEKIYNDIKSRENDTSIGAENIANEVMSYYKKKAKETYNRNQLEDLSGLDQCYNLEQVALTNQRKIQKIDIKTKNIYNLFLIECDVKKVTGLDNIKKTKNTVIDFNYCEKLNELENIDIFLEKMYGEKDTIVNLPAHYFPYLLKSKPSLAQKYWFVNSNIIWNDFSTFSTLQMLTLKKKCDDIINTICDKNKSDIYNMSIIYRYICDNIKYASEKLNQQLTWQKEEKKDKEYQELRAQIRSAYYSFFNKEGVCAGIASLFNFFLAELGIYSEAILCGTDKFLVGREFINITHSISKVYINDKPYYCDPTWDLGKDKLNFFLLNENEVENKKHKILLNNFDNQSSPSLQSTLKGTGILDREGMEALDDRSL